MISKELMSFTTYHNIQLSTPNSQLFQHIITLNFQLSTLNSQFLTLNFQFSTLNFHFLTLNFQLSTLNYISSSSSSNPNNAGSTKASRARRSFFVGRPVPRALSTNPLIRLISSSSYCFGSVTFS